MLTQLLLLTCLWTTPSPARTLEESILPTSWPRPSWCSTDSVYAPNVSLVSTSKSTSPVFTCHANRGDASAIIASRGDKVLELKFLRSVKKDQITASFSEGFKNNCATNCEQDGAQFAKFNEVMRDLRAGDRIRIITTPDDVVRVEVSGRESTAAEFTGATMRQNVLAAFLGPRPASPEFKAGLLD